MWNWTFCVFLGLCALTNLASAAPDKCEARAIQAVERKFSGYFFEGGRRIRKVEVVSCQQRLSRRGESYQSCEVGASTGEGAGDVTFGVAQSVDCGRVIAAFLVGEE